MADRDKIRSLAIRKRTEKRKRTLAWNDVATAYQAATGDQRQAFAKAIYGGQPQQLWQTIDAVMRPYVTAQATIEVDAAMADDAFTLDELEDVFL